MGQLRGGRRVAADGGTRAAVPVVLVGTAAVPLDLIEVFRQREDRPETGHLREVLVHLGEMRGDRCRAVGVDFMLQRVACPDRAQRKVAGDHDARAVRRLGDGHGIEVAAGRTAGKPPGP